MTDSNPSPDWNLLPHSPQAFFDLVDDFGRKDLKRSYNRLIRNFKPEKYPQEFQRIRGAYEQLDNHLRYGTHFLTDHDANQTYQWVTDSQISLHNGPPPAESSPPTSSQSPTRGQQTPQEEKEKRSTRYLPLHERIQQEPLADIYRNLSKKSNKSAYDYYALAVMSDIVHRKDGLQFVRWILAGIKALPTEHGLYALLGEYYRSPISSSAIPSLLISTSQVVAKDHFYSITESLWLRMLREFPFMEFRTTLERCENNLPSINIDSQLAFSIEILKSALWKADSEWIEKTMSLIDENFERIPFHLQYDIDILDLLKKYIAHRDEFLAQQPMRQKVDRAIHAYFSENQQTGDQAVLEAQIAASQDPQSLFEAFPYDNGEDFEPLFLVWTTISEDVAERNVAPLEQEEDSSIWLSRVRALLQRVDSTTNNSRAGVSWWLASLGYRCGIGIMYVFFIIALTLLASMFTISINSELIPFLILLVSIVGGVLMARLIHNKFLAPLWARYNLKKSIHCYRTMWRREIIELMQRSHLSFFVLRELFLDCNIAGLSYANWTIGHFQQDYAMAFYSTSQRFVV